MNSSNILAGICGDWIDRLDAGGDESSVGSIEFSFDAILSRIPEGPFHDERCELETADEVMSRGSPEAAFDPVVVTVNHLADPLAYDHGGDREDRCR